MLDWKNEEDYAFCTDKLPLERWAWEFLRRNLEYRADFIKAITLKWKYRKLHKQYMQWKQHTLEQYIRYKKDKKNKKNVKHPVLNEDENPFLDELSQEYLIFEPEKSKDLSIRQWRIRCALEKENPAIYTPMEYYIQKWHLAVPIQTWEKNTPPPFRYPEITPDIVNWEAMDSYFLDDEQSYEQKEEWLVLAFDLRLPIGIQLENAMKPLKGKKDKHNLDYHGPTKRQFKEWKLYLRILDATAENVALIDISKELFPKAETSYPENVGQKRVSASKKTATELSKNGYIRILMHCNKAS